MCYNASDKRQKRNKKIAKKAPSTWQLLAWCGNVGINFVASLCVGIFIGRCSDDYLRISPLGTIVCTFLGFVVALLSTYKLMKRNNLW